VEGTAEAERDGFMIPTLALDLATKTGWAHSNGESGVQDFKPRRGESPGMRYLALGAWLNRMYGLAPFDLVVYEQAHYRGGAATEVLVGMVTKVQEWCAERGIEYTSRHSKAIKKHALGKGKGSKLAMRLSAEVKWGRDIESDDEADALWLLSLVQSELEGK